MYWQYVIDESDAIGLKLGPANSIGSFHGIVTFDGRTIESFTTPSGHFRAPDVVLSDDLTDPVDRAIWHRLRDTLYDELSEVIRDHFTPTAVADHAADVRRAAAGL